MLPIIEQQPETNPFLKMIAEEDQVKVLSKDYVTKVINHRDEISILTNNLSFEADNSTKVYNDSKRRNTYADLTPQAIKVFLLVIMKLERNLDYVELKIEQLQDFTGWSKNSIYKYIDELAQSALIRRRQSKHSSYWINPRYIFSGNRLEYFQTIQQEQRVNVLKETVNLTELAASKTVRKKSQIMKYFGFATYYELKIKLGQEQLDNLLSGDLKLEDAKVLKK